MYHSKYPTYSICVLLLLFWISVSSQEYSTKSKKAIRLYEDAQQKMQAKDYLGSINFLQLAAKEDVNFTEAWLLMADIYDINNDKEQVIECCKNAVKSGVDKYPVVYYFLSSAQYSTGQYQAALDNISLFISRNQFTPSQKKQADKILRNCRFAVEALLHPVSFNPVDLGENVNTKYEEYWPSLSADEEMLVFTRQIPKDENNPKVFGNRQEDIYVSVRKDKKWQKAEPIGRPLNTSDNEGAQFITSDGKRMYFTACNRIDGLGKCDIYMSEKTNTGWSEPFNLGEPVNSGYSEKQPSVSSDGKTLFFASNRPGSKGSFDLWTSTLDDKGKWSKPVNLGDSINTPDDEQSPFIHPDNQTLYFASNGLTGMGGYDLYYCRKKGMNIWSTPVNLGYPINTFSDEVGIVVNAKGDIAYFASDRNQDKGRDIFEFELYASARPLLVSYLKGKVFDAENKTPLDAKFELIDLKTSKIMNQAVSNKYSGEFLVCIPTDNDYALNVSRKGYLFYSENFTLSGINDKSKPYNKDIPLQAIKEGKKVVLKNIFFETNSYELKPESKVELNKLLQFLNENAALKIEIGGHTDNVGNDGLNQKLSENRAKSVVNFLVAKGIVQNRIVSKGYGKTQPVADNGTEEGRALNRRTEFKIIGS
jgi:outer membrane protein OmpA-like peptidoglycan-associated protein